MKQEDIIRMAREAGMGYVEYIGEEYMQQVKRFAALVAAAEREACAKVCEEMKGQCWAYDHDTIAEAIRARGQA
jgi:hypothetical protein